jgi:hypothetical protein
MMKDVTLVRRVDCRLYDACLCYAVKRDWPNWSCALCEEFVHSDEIRNAAQDINKSVSDAKREDPREKG